MDDLSCFSFAILSISDDDDDLSNKKSLVFGNVWILFFLRWSEWNWVLNKLVFELVFWQSVLDLDVELNVTDLIDDLKNADKKLGNKIDKKNSLKKTNGLENEEDEEELVKEEEEEKDNKNKSNGVRKDLRLRTKFDETLDKSLDDKLVLSFFLFDFKK